MVNSCSVFTQSPRANETSHIAEIDFQHSAPSRSKQLHNIKRPCNANNYQININFIFLSAINFLFLIDVVITLWPNGRS